MRGGGAPEAMACSTDEFQRVHPACAPLTYVLLNANDNILEYYEVAIYQWAIRSLMEFNNVPAARAGIIEEAKFEEAVEVDEEEVAAVAAEVAAEEAEVAKAEQLARM